MLNLYGRIWTYESGETFDGELYRYSKIGVNIKTSEGKNVLLDEAKLIEKDKEFLKKNYSDLRTNKDSEEEDLPVQEFPKIKLDKDGIAFRWSDKFGAFYTRHFDFNMKRKLSQSEALDLALRCESTYEVVRSLPFWPDEFKRKKIDFDKKNISSSAKKNTKFKIVIEQLKGNRYAGHYDPNTDIVTVDYDILISTFDKELDFVGTLGHEIAHQLTVYHGGTTAVKEGLTEFIEMGIYKDGSVTYEHLEKIIKASPRFTAYSNKPARFTNLKKFLSMSHGTFHAQSKDKEHLNYLQAQMVFVYFALKEPEVLRSFLSKALHAESEKVTPVQESERCQKAFPILLNERKEKELERAITDYYASLGIKIDF